MHNQRRHQQHLFLLQWEQPFQILTDIVVVHDIEASFRLLVLVHVLEHDESLEGFEVGVLVEFLLDGEVLVEVELVEQDAGLEEAAVD